MIVLRPVHAEVLWEQRPDPQDGDRQAFDACIARLMVATDLPVAWPFVPSSVEALGEIPRGIKACAILFDVVFSPALRSMGAFWDILEAEGEAGTSLAFRPLAPAILHLALLAKGEIGAHPAETSAKLVLDWIAPGDWDAVCRAAERQDTAAEALIAGRAIVDGEGINRRVMRLAAGAPMRVHDPDAPSSDGDEATALEWVH